MRTYRIGVIFTSRGRDDDSNFLELCQAAETVSDGDARYDLVMLRPEDLMSSPTKLQGLCGTIVYGIHCTDLSSGYVRDMLHAVASAGSPDAFRTGL